MQLERSKSPLKQRTVLYPQVSPEAENSVISKRQSDNASTEYEYIHVRTFDQGETKW